VTFLGDLERASVQGALASATAPSGLLRFITAGSVDDGKSTLIGRLLHDSRAIFEDQFAAVERASVRRGAGAVDLSLLTDGLEAEREQGITIDVAYRYFATPARKFIIADTPGHEQYTRNMVTGASNVDLAILLVDARKGVLPQTRRHAAIAHLLGIRHVFVAVNKMDLIDAGAAAATFDGLRDAFRDFADRLGLADVRFFPISALRGDNVVTRSDAFDWYDGPALLEALETVAVDTDAVDAPFRFPVQLVSRPFPGRDGRSYLGRVAAGRVVPGDAVRVLPAGERAQVTAIVTLDGGRPDAIAGDSVGLVLDREIDVSRGDMLVADAAPPRVEKALEIDLCWLSPTPLVPGARLLVKHTTRTVKARVAAITSRLDLQTVEAVPVDGPIAMNDLVRASLLLAQPLCVDAYRASRATGALILVDEHTNETVGAGLVV
jgi:sulfate adenylyltransferase subunit 1